MRAAPGAKTGWERFARRARVPLGFVVAAIFLVFARPTLDTLAWSLLLVLPGLWLRGYAAGYVKKNAELTRTGPYAHTRNPLYLGSMLIAAGFAVAAGRWWLVALLVAMFLAIYVPTILSEETYLRTAFHGFDDYASRVPRLGWRLRPARFLDIASTHPNAHPDAHPRPNPGPAPRFALERYRHHREYNAAIGAVAIYAALALRMAFSSGLFHRWF